MFRSLALALFLLTAPATPLWAGPDVADPVIERIETQGYTVDDVRRTWLGRIVITARNDSHLREIVLNRRSGEVLRDALFPLPGAASVKPQEPSPSVIDETVDAVTDTVDSVTDSVSDGLGGVGGGVGIGGIGE